MSCVGTPKRLKRAASLHESSGQKDYPLKRARSDSQAKRTSVQLQHPREPVGQPWPNHELFVYDVPDELGWGQLLLDVLKARGWRVSTTPCRTTTVSKPDGSEISTVFVKEFEACLQGQPPDKVFGKRGAVEEGYHLQSLKLNKHALWMMGWAAYRVPGTANGRQIFRQDFIEAIAEHGALLAGKPGNYRTCKFPGTETALFKTNLSIAFRDKPWYPVAYVLPKEKDLLLTHMSSGGAAHSNYWIAKPRNDYGGSGIRVWQGADPELEKIVSAENGTSRSVVQRYLADPLLIGGYKFHMRIHLVITSLDPLEAFVQHTGQCLFATEPYTLSSKTLGVNFKPPVHVTNMGLNATEENKENFLRPKPVIGKGQQFRVRHLEKYLTDNHPGFDRKELWGQIVNIAAETARYIGQAPSVRKFGKLMPDRHFEIFGMDLMLDKKLNVYMCETNTDPGLSYPDKDVLGSPNPDYVKEKQACFDTWHDLFTLLGLDAGRPQGRGSLQNWYKVDFSH